MQTDLRASGRTGEIEEAKQCGPGHPACVCRPEKPRRRCEFRAVTQAVEPVGKMPLDQRHGEGGDAAFDQNCPRELGFAGDTDNPDGILLRQRGNQFRHSRHQFDVLMAIQVGRLDAAVKQPFDLQLQFGLNAVTKSGVRGSQSSKDGTDPRELSPIVEQLDGIGLREGPSLRQIEMNSQIEWPQVVTP